MMATTTNVAQPTQPIEPNRIPWWTIPCCAAGRSSAMAER
jgi:hypothetical protein